MPSTRRHFLMGLAATSLASALPRRVRAASALETVRIGLIGCGVRGRAFAGRVVAACDPDRQRLGEYATANNISSENTTTDLRHLLDRRDIDAVVIATPDHWHAPAAILACQAGKHVYVEKPASHNFRESQWLLAAAERSGVVAQHGTQQRSRDFIRNAIDELHAGVIGDVLVAKVWNIQQRSTIGHAAPGECPTHVDYDTWVGPAAWLPYQSNRLHSDWHWWHNFGTGDIGNDGAHEIDYARWGLGADAHPIKIAATGGKYFFDDDQQFPDTATCTFEFAPTTDAPRPKQLIFEMRLWSRNYPYNCDSGVEFYGTKGQLFLSKRGKLRLTGPDNEVLRDERAPADEGFTHLDNFVAAVRDQAVLNAPLLEAHRTVALIHLANAAIRAGRSLDFDPINEKVVRDDEANSLLGRDYREGGHWGIPKDV